MSRALERLLDELKSCYFPRWDRKKEWKIVARNFKGLFGGYCDRDTKKILIRPSAIEEGNDELRKLICHEVCHVCTCDHHGKKWQTRYLKVATKASAIGDTVLAEKILKEVKCYSESPIRAYMVYNTIQDVVLDQPKASFRDAIRWLASDYGFTRRDF